MKRSQRSTQGASEPEPAPTVAAGEAGGTRAAILNAATRLLTERGLSATRTRDVTALAGLSTGLQWDWMNGGGLMMRRVSLQWRLPF